ncbi:ATP-dependent DNA ligase [Sphingosinicella ginsenosidimutans]|uniref:DNA ligase (ATP) n=2 Tax=Allosphingosinicella ginsenosidimutans TaxID=1176539 RepID=A0A5C6TZI1_9SPHN|nr:ATP-dependent DNA ligase [Sphingosinicella ginsenosidimutans]
MEAKLAQELPDGDGWQFEPKWDGFRALVRRDGGEVAIVSKSGRPLDRYFPEVAANLRALRENRFVLDGELLLPMDGRLAFDALQARLHPAESRIRRLARETPALLMLFDLLFWKDRDLTACPLAERRRCLEAFFAGVRDPGIRLSPCTDQRAQAIAWLEQAGGALDGVIAKRTDERYQPGKRAMVKVKVRRSADCVVGGMRRGEGGRIASLLLGLYDDDDRLNLVGFLASLTAARSAEIERLIAPLIGGEGFTGKAPGGPSRWSAGKDTSWIPLKPELVVEVLYDQVTGARFRHGTRFLRWRPDKRPDQCRMEQLDRPLALARLGAI